MSDNPEASAQTAPRKGRPKKHAGEPHHKGGGAPHASQDAEMDGDATPPPPPPPVTTAAAAVLQPPVPPTPGAAAPAVSAIPAAGAPRGQQQIAYISDMKRMSITDLHLMAKNLNIEGYSALLKHDLIFRIIKEKVSQNVALMGEGVLEILPDGFGFLRSPDYDYLPCPDDIYISPSQIRR